MSFLSPPPPPDGPVLIRVVPHGKKFKCKFMFHHRVITKIMTQEKVIELKEDDHYHVVNGY